MRQPPTSRPSASRNSVIAVSIGYIMWVISDRRKFQWEVNAEVAKLHKYGVLDPSVTGIVSTGSGVY